MLQRKLLTLSGDFLIFCQEKTYENLKYLRTLAGESRIQGG
jgi:hypothetical protein